MYLTLERYSRPSSLEECLRLLAEPGQRAALLSGGTDLNASTPSHEELTHVIDLQALPLDHVVVEGGRVRLGARVTLGRVRRDEKLAALTSVGGPLRALAEAAAAFAILAIQNRATLGGRIVVERADQDVPPALCALGARLRLARLDGSALTEEEIDYPLGSTARAALRGALVTEIILPIGDGGGRSALRRFGRSAVDAPLATCAAAIHGDAARLVANVQGPSAADMKRLPRTEALASGWLSERPSDWRDRARDSLLGELAAYQDPWAGGAYRQDLTATLMVRAMAAVFGEEEIQ